MRNTNKALVLPRLFPQLIQSLFVYTTFIKNIYLLFFIYNQLYGIMRSVYQEVSDMGVSKKQQQIRSTILDKLYAKGPISRIDISKETGVTPATVSAVTGEMIGENLIYELGEQDHLNKVGRKKILLNIAPIYCYYVGIEISEKRFSFALTDNTGTVVTTHIEKITNINVVQEMGVHFFLEALTNFLATLSDYPIKAIGIALPGHYESQKSSSIITNNTIWKDFDLEKIKDTISYPTFFANNVNCMAIAHRLFSTENQDENYIYLHLGRGMHSSYMYNGDLYGKENMLIGEIGHTIVQPDGEVCECGKRGCLQTYASETWLIKKARILYRGSSTSYLHQLAEKEAAITIQNILMAYNLGDEGIINLIHSAVKYLALSITNLNMMIDANKVYLHSKLLSEPKIVDLLSEQLDYDPKLLTLPRHPQIIIEPYSQYTGAVAGASLCVYRDLLGKDL